MTLSEDQLLWLEPTLDDLGDLTESPSEYASRVQRLLPNFPEQVLIQWFLEHDGVIDEHAGLDYQNLRFKLAQFGPEELGLPCLAEHEIITQYRDHFLRGVHSPQMNRLANYMRVNRTWPVPPLIFDNPDGRFVASWGLKYSRPFDLLEGHHRMALLYAFGLHTEGSHSVWLVQKDPAHNPAFKQTPSEAA
ncbi:hypothetical protein [Chitinimonas taiwanensis]|uniref:hypothetical protein n=1 Tax=Chitinimonas taiwanensis TaxID=240412 RepID=UPI0035B2E213